MGMKSRTDSCRGERGLSPEMACEEREEVVRLWGRLIPGIEFATRVVPVTRPLASSLNWRDFTKELPYFRWFAKDAETDETYLAMTDEECGFYHRCLNVAWTNNGIPADPAARARVLRRNRNQADARWTARVASRFVPHEQRPGYLANARQELERVHAKHKSIKATESVNARYERSTSENAVVGSRALARADSVCVSSSLVLESKNGNQNQVRAREPELGVAGIASATYAQFWVRWCELTKRKQRESYGLQAWISVVEDMAVAAMACLERYGLSGEVQRGAVTNVDRWIFDQARDKFTGEWQPEPQALSAAERKSKALREAVAKLDEEEESGYRQ